MHRRACRPGAVAQQLGQAAVAGRPLAVRRLRHCGLSSLRAEHRTLQPCNSRQQCSRHSSSSSRLVHTRVAATETAESVDTYAPGDWRDIDSRSRSRFVNRLNQEHGIEDFVEFHQADGGLAAAYIMHPNGHTLEIHLQGATITRWLTPEGRDLLFTRPDVTYEPGVAINSGIPIAFPQWREGQLPFNGFADKLQWEVVTTDLDFEFTNSLTNQQDFREGRAELLIDEEGNSAVPAPVGVIDADDFMDDDDVMQQVDAGLNALYAEEAGSDEEPVKPKSKRGRKSKAAAAAEAEAAAAAADTDPDPDQHLDPDPDQDQDLDPDSGDQAAAAAAANLEVPSSHGSEEEQLEGEESDDTAAAAAAAAAGEDEEGELPEEQEEEDEIDFGIIEDPAPYIILKLSDTEETRAIWPHKFDLFYKITLMETDDFPDPKGGYPAGLHDWTGSSRPLRPEHEEFLEALDTGDEEQIQAAATETVMAEARDLVSVEDGQASYNGYRIYTDDDGHFVEDDEEDLIEDLLDGTPGDDDAEPIKKRGRKKQTEETAGGAETGEIEPAAAAADGDDSTAAAAAAAAAGDDSTASAAAAAAVQEEQEEDVIDLNSQADMPRELYDPPEQPMQIKMEWILINKDPEDSPPFEFQLGALSHLRTYDQMRFGEFVRILGLGGVMTFDYSEDPRRAKLLGCQDDYITFEGERRDTVYIGSHDADVSFCPGNRTHFQLLCREGLQDHVVYHPGAVGLPTLDTDDARFFAQVGAGRLALPKKLEPGEMWKGEYVLRHNPFYWDPPVFDRDGPQPMPLIQPKQDEADDPDGLEDVEDRVEGLDSSGLGGGPATPYLDE